MSVLCATEIECPPAASILNGQVAQLTANSIQYSCNNGYTLAGTAVRFCMLNGQYSGNAPTCNSEYWHLVLCSFEPVTAKSITRPIHIFQNWSKTRKIDIQFFSFFDQFWKNLNRPHDGSCCLRLAFAMLCLEPTHHTVMCLSRAKWETKVS